MEWAFLADKTSLWQWVWVRIWGPSAFVAVLSSFGTWIIPQSGFLPSGAPAVHAGDVFLNKTIRYFPGHYAAGSLLFAGSSPSTQAWPTRSFVTWVQLLLQPRGYHPALLISGLTNLPSLLDHAILLYRLSPLHKLFPRSDSTFTSNSVPWDPVQISPPLQVPRPVSALVPRRLVQSCFNI